MKEEITKQSFKEILLRYSDEEELEQIKHLFPANNKFYKKVKDDSHE